eukprot:CAMPEP_0183294802 /NCGR_PEP_ID=MMETSP0160_2-20130417/2985_1 /TAXON_ID=2839 ORGANISM="Odontella Sinensis, Strain Grunow 1884" /NCGR_SAMPLE_ID=MMETSP0160_2 /ASSEMBLY_ACC=CAM_ASM_000250 /LENGTH=295 /DNA_ID=CAMNT_0025456171 /DNA_START=98 /DNA_END=982 /DNA_ORIENTATION=+
MTAGSPSTSGGGRADHSHVNPMDQYIQILFPPAGSSSAPPNPASVRAVLHQSLANPRVYAGFAELRSLPAVEALDRTGDGDAALRTLELFANGTYSDYASAKAGTYLSLTDGQEHKLRQLTVVSLAQRTAADAAASDVSKKKKGRKKGPRGKKVGGGKAPYSGAAVAYSSLRAELGLAPDSPVRELEDLLISCLYAGLVVGRLDQRTMSLLVGSSGGGAHTSAHQPPCVARDVCLDDVPRMIAALEAFRTRGEEAARSLSDAARAAAEGRGEDAARWMAAEGRIAEIRTKAKERG